MTPPDDRITLGQLEEDTSRDRAAREDLEGHVPAPVGSGEPPS